MTTESVPAPHTRSLTVTPAAVRHPVPLRLRPLGRRGPVPHARTAGLAAADVLALLLAVALLPPLAPLAPVLVPLALLQPALHACRGLYRPRLAPSALAELPTAAGIALLQWLILAEAARLYGSGAALGPREVFLAAALQAGFCCAGRALVHRAARRSAARRPRAALVAGQGPVARQVTAALQGRPEYGLLPVGRIRVPADTATGTETTGTVPVVTARHRQEGPPVPPALMGPQEIERAVTREDVRDVLFTRPPGADPETAAVLGLLARHGCRLWLVDGGATTGNLWCRTPGHDQLWGFSVQPLRDGPHRPAGRAVKRVLDTLLAALALVFAAPVLAVCALAVRLTDGPGVIFRQERVGLHGRPFTLLKFRTLCPVDEHESATRWNVAYDRRMSATGNLLRRTSLDELPQLWNVLKGDMSLVGPRPERPYFVAKFSHAHPGYQARHRMPVGITGLAQIHGLRGDTSIEERARFDNHYIDTWTPWRDVCILARTAASLFRLGGS
ncbi:exopolysaccharide biosynthesis polyprenyl glycosylphosphotransferase [Streptomyces yaizuensis]|uniref:Sugar transferase n=1 Tax=Streptomyces yaizuensis TaxID=2989713 RepID=A0ABQ5NVE8_9ACTN|nr:exopolysaccharide biosynthesis polyprenyl glycosylphosphotransferase [Streptomyces sp. YSPA8]GLF94345.1 sugar transferase [Streptomyces sp. YSPA8]